MDRVLTSGGIVRPSTSMKQKLLGSIILPAILALTLFSGNARSAEAEHSDMATGGPAPVETPPTDQKPKAILQEDNVVLPAQTSLSPAAQETYAYLLFIQALLEEDEAAILGAAPELAKGNAPASVWLDGSVWLMSRKSPNAVVFLEQAIKAYPDDANLNLLYAESLGDHGMASRGVDVMREFIARHPDMVDAKCELALLLVKDKQFDEARKVLASISPKQRTPYVDYYEAQALLGMGQRVQAIPFLRKAVKGLPEMADPLVELAMAYEEEGNLREARSTYEKLQKLNYSPQQVAIRLVNLSLKLRQPEKALQYIRQGPASLPFRLAAANMLLDSRHYLQAESILKQIAGDAGAPPEVFLMLAELTYEQRRNLNMALSWLDKLPADSQIAPQGALMRAQLYAEAGKRQKAMQTADLGIKTWPDLPQFPDLKIRLLARDKKTDQALELARAAVAKWPDAENLNFLLASLLDEKGLKKDALAIMEEIIKKHPDNYQALNYIGFTLADENRDLPRAIELLTKADKLAPNQSYIIDSLAWAHHRAGNDAEALRQIRRAINLGDSQDAAIWEHYGDIASRQKLRDEARKAYRRAIDLKPANADDIRKRLSKL